MSDDNPLAALLERHSSFEDGYVNCYCGDMFSNRKRWSVHVAKVLEVAGYGKFPT